MPIFGPDMVSLSKTWRKNTASSLSRNAEPAEIPLILFAHDEALRLVFLQNDFVFALADLDDQGDFANAEIIARAVFEREDLVAVDLQVFSRSQQVDGGKTVRLDSAARR